MAIGFVADYKANSGNISVNTLSVSLSGTTSGNLLIACLFNRFGWGAPPVLSGWTPIMQVNRTASQHGVYVWYKYADGSDTYVPVWGGTAARATAIVRELSGVPASAPVCGWSTNSADVFHGGAASSVSTVSQSPPVSSGAILSVLCVQDFQDWTTGSSGADITAPGSDDGYSYTTLSNCPLVGMSLSTFSDQSAVSSTWSTSDADAGGDGRQGCIDIFLSDEPYADLPSAVGRWSTYDTGTANTSGSLTVSGATAGNLLVAICCKADHAGTTTTATGYTSRGWWNAATETWSGRWFTREATGDSNDNFNPSWTGGASYDLLVMEFANAATTPEDTAENTAEIDDTAASTIETGTATPTSSLSLAVAIFACESRQEWSNLTYGRNIGGEDGWLWAGNGLQTAGDAYCKIGIKVLHGTSAEAMTITSTGSNGVAYAAIGVVPAAVQPELGFTVNSLEVGDWIHAEGISVTAQLSNADASGKKVYIKQGGTRVEQTVTDESTSHVTFTADYGSLTRGDATLQVEGT